MSLTILDIVYQRYATLSKSAKVGRFESERGDRGQRVSQKLCQGADGGFRGLKLKDSRRGVERLQRLR